MITWHIITCEYPPQIGGVSDYTRLLKHELIAAGDQVFVYAPAFPSQQDANVHRTLGSFSSADLRLTSALLDQQPEPRTLLVQWVPHGYGRRSMNIAFCRWIASRALGGDRVYLMVHEPFLEFGHGWKQSAVALVHRIMVRTLLGSADRVFISIPEWENYLCRYAPPVTKFEWLPIPATVLVQKSSSTITEIRSRFGHDALILGHLGTYSAQLGSILKSSLPKILAEIPNLRILLLGKNSDTFAVELRSTSPELTTHVHGTGMLDDRSLSHHLNVCDLMLQPYPDGLTSRRTSLMNALSHGIAVVSNSGRLTENLWSESNAVSLAATTDSAELSRLCIKLLRDHRSRQNLAESGLSLYRSRFDWPKVVATLRSEADPGSPAETSTTSNHSGAAMKLE
jgi:glycosyltransferase involved in cell wall biosynthesis